MCLLGGTDCVHWAVRTVSTGRTDCVHWAVPTECPNINCVSFRRPCSNYVNFYIAPQNYARMKLTSNQIMKMLIFATVEKAKP